MTRRAALLAVLVVGCARQAPAPPEPVGPPEAAPDQTQGDASAWTEADEVSGEEMPPPVIVAEGDRHTETATVEEEAPAQPPSKTEVIDLTADPVSAPADTVHAPGDRSPSGSMLQGIINGPNK